MGLKKLFISFVLFAFLHVPGVYAVSLNALWATCTSQYAHLRDSIYTQWQQTDRKTMQDYVVGATFMSFFGYTIWSSRRPAQDIQDDHSHRYDSEDFYLDGDDWPQYDSKDFNIPSPAGSYADWMREDNGAGIDEGPFYPTVFQDRKEVIDELSYAFGGKDTATLLAEIRTECSNSANRQHQLRLLTLDYILDPPYKNPILAASYQQALRSLRPYTWR